MLASIELHRRAGFQPVGTLTNVGYKFEPLARQRDDAARARRRRQFGSVISRRELINAPGRTTGESPLCSPIADESLHRSETTRWACT